MLTEKDIVEIIRFEFMQYKPRWIETTYFNDLVYGRAKSIARAIIDKIREEEIKKSERLYDILDGELKAIELENDYTVD